MADPRLEIINVPHRSAQIRWTVPLQTVVSVSPRRLTQKPAAMACDADDVEASQGIGETFEHKPIIDPHIVVAEEDTSSSLASNRSVGGGHGHSRRLK
jgi:hypothetical protein